MCACVSRGRRASRMPFLCCRAAAQVWGVGMRGVPNESVRWGGVSSRMTVSAVSSMWKFSQKGVVAFSGCPRGRVRTGRPLTGGAYLPSLTK
eukprot:2186998-Pleurochrysis_carterae.AAC.1